MIRTPLRCTASAGVTNSPRTASRAMLAGWRCPGAGEPRSGDVAGGGTGWCGRHGGPHHSSNRLPNARDRATAGGRRRRRPPVPPTAQPSVISMPPAPNAASVDRVAPISTGTTTGSMSSGRRVSGPCGASGKAAVERTDPRQRYDRDHHGDHQQHRCADAAHRTVQQHDRQQDGSASSAASWAARAMALPRNSPAGVTPATRKASSAPVVTLHGEDPLDHHQQAERRRGHRRQPGGHLLGHVGVWPCRGRRRTAP